MRYKTIIKRTQKDSDLSWLHSFLKEKLNGERIVKITASEKMVHNIFEKYGRSIKMSGADYRTIYNDERYAFEVLESKNGKYGIYYLVRIICIEKDIEFLINERVADEEKRLNRKLKKGKIDENIKNQLMELNKELITIEVNCEYNPYTLPISDNKLYNESYCNNEKAEAIYDKIESIEEKYL